MPYAITYRLVKGSAITAAEYDASLHNLDDRVTTLETSRPTPDELSSVTLSGDDLSFHLVSGTVLGPVTVTLPRWRDRGEFVGGMVLAINDTFTVAGYGLYVALVDHTAAPSFVSTASATPATAAGNFLTGRLYVIASVGTTDFTAIGATSNAVGVTFRATGAGSGTGTAGLALYDRIIAAVDLTTAVLNDLTDVTVASPSAGQVLSYNGSSWVNGVVPGGPVTADTVSTYTLALADLNAYLRLSDASAVAVTVPTNAAAAFPVGATVAFEQTAAGAITIAGDIGVTINCAASHTPVTNGQWAVAQLKKVAANEWTLFGNLVPA